MAKLVCKTAFNAREKAFPGIVFTEPSLAQQHFKQESDVNYIVNRYLQTGVLEHVAADSPQFADLSLFEGDFDLRRAYEAVEAAEASFGQLPSDVRKKLNNDPSLLMSWLSDPVNKADAIKYGLMVDNSAQGTPAPVKPAPAADKADKSE